MSRKGCAIGANVTTGTVTAVTSMPMCVSGLQPDGKGDTLYAAVGAAQPDPEGGNFPTGTWLTADQKMLTTTDTAEPGNRGPL